MSEIIIKRPYEMDAIETCLRFSATAIQAPKHNCRIRKCRRNRHCSGKTIASDGRLEALAPAEIAAMGWPSDTRIPPCFPNIWDSLLPVIMNDMKETYWRIARDPDRALCIYMLRKIVMPKYFDDFPRDWPKKPA